MAELAHDVEKRRRMGEAGRRRARSNFGEDRMHDAYAEVYETLLNPDGNWRPVNRNSAEAAKN